MGKLRLKFSQYGRSTRFKALRGRRLNQSKLNENSSSDDGGDEAQRRGPNAGLLANAHMQGERADHDAASSSSESAGANSMVDLSSADKDDSIPDLVPVGSPAQQSSDSAPDDDAAADSQPEDEASSRSSEDETGDKDEEQDSDHVSPHESLPSSPDPDHDDDGEQSDNSSASDSEDEGGEELLYPGSCVTLAESMLSILALSLNHNLSGTCLSDMLGLLSLHCPQKNPNQKSLYMFKKYFSEMSLPLQRHYFCKQCYAPLENRFQVCHLCHEQRGTGYFISISIITQLQLLLKRPGFFNKLSHRFQRQKQVPENIEDIYDGNIFKELSSVGNILNNESNLALFWCSDGIPTTRSSKCSIWPFYISILNLPYSERTKIDNVMLAALWYGHEKPIPNLFLRPVVNDIQRLHAGLLFNTPEGEKFIRGIVVGGTGDLPARATFLNLKTHSATYGCHKCKIRSIQLEPGQRRQKRVFLFQRNLSLRTDQETEQFAAQAADLNRDVFGVKGRTIMTRIAHNPIRSTSCDDMHPIYQGLVKKMLTLWFDVKYRLKPWSLYALLAVVDNRLCAITPPQFVQRLPRSINENFKHWKASELKAWLFYYSLPILHGIMAQVYIKHWSLLVLGIYLLSKNSVSEHDIILSSHILTEFVCRFEEIYERDHMSCNLHQVQHIASICKDLGPLWAHSCFPFEDLNGKLLKLVTGTRFADLQICDAAALYLNLSTAKNEKLQEGRPAKEFCEKLCNPKRRFKLTLIISPKFAVAGKLKKTGALPLLVGDTLTLSGIQGTTFHLFYRLYNRSESLLFTSEAYNRVIRTNNKFVKYLDNNNVAFGAVHSFVRVSNCECGDICNDCNASFYAIIRKYQTQEMFFALPGIPIPYIHQGIETNDIVAINVFQLIGVCFFVKVSAHAEYLVEPVNTVEAE